MLGAYSKGAKTVVYRFIPSLHIIMPNAIVQADKYYFIYEKTLE